MLKEQLKAALIVPETNGLTVSPPVQLGYLASVLKAKGWSVSIYDFSLPAAKLEQGLAEISDSKPVFTGISAKTVEFENAIHLASLLKQELPGTFLAIGGPHPTALPQRSLLESKSDCIVFGEGEITVSQVADAVESGSRDLAGIKGVCYPEGDEAVMNLPREFIHDLDSIPIPAWELIPPCDYSLFPWQLFKKRAVVAPILTTRGCPYNCSYCASRTLGRKMRFRSAASVVFEMELLIKDFAVGEFHIMDDNFIARKEHAIDVCEEMIRRDLDILWKTPNGIRVDKFDDDLADVMKSSGCYQIGFGIESGNQEVLDDCGKSLDLSLVPEKIAIAKKHGIEVYGFFIIGLPGDTRETIRETIGFMRRRFDQVNVAFCIPYPGSKIYENMAKDGRLEGVPWNEYIHYRLFPVSDVSSEELKKLMRKALLGFYLRPGRLMGLLFRIKLPQLRYVFRLVKNYLFSEEINETN